MPRTACLLIALALLSACERPGDPARARAAAGRALRGALAYPRSSPVNVAAGTEAAELTMTTPDSVGTVVAWFRRALPMNGWKVERELAGQGGVVTMYAEHDGRPLWITLRPNTGGPGTTYSMIGAIPADSGK